MSFETAETSGSLQDRLRIAKAELDRNPEDLIALIDKCVIGVCVNDHKGNFIHVNEAYCQIYGYEYEELIGQNFTKMAPSEDRHEVWQAIFDAFIEDGQEMAGEWVVMAKDGRLLTIYTDAVRIGHPDRGGYQKVTFVNDITELRTIQRDFEGLRHQFGALIDQPFMPVAILDVNSGQILSGNTVFLKYSSLTAGSLQNTDIGGIIAPQDTSWETVLNNLHASPEGVSMTLKGRGIGEKPVQAHLRPIVECGRQAAMLMLKV